MGFIGAFMVVKMYEITDDSCRGILTRDRVCGIGSFVIDMVNLRYCCQSCPVIKMIDVVYVGL